jgi:hypothetical protein
MLKYLQTLKIILIFWFTADIFMYMDLKTTSQ